MFVLKNAKTNDETRESYEALYSRGWIPPRSSLFIWLLNLLKIKPGQTILDVACGEAELGQHAQQKGLVYYGVDISLKAVYHAKPKKVIVGDGTHLPFQGNQFDYVSCIGSLEHFLDITLGVRELARVVKHDGLVCILVPNAFSITWNMLSVWKTGDLADDGQLVQRFGTHDAWRRLIEANGMTIFQTLGYERSKPTTDEEMRFYLTQPKELLLAFLTPFIPLNLRRCFVFLCKKS